MPDADANRVALSCPHCGAENVVPGDGVSATCVKCFGHYRIQEVLHPTVRVQRVLPTAQVRCLDCRTAITVAAEAKSCWCPKCSRHLDLSDVVITATVCKHVRTLGTLTVERNARLINSKTSVGAARLIGRFEGTLSVEGLLEIAPTGGLQGTLIRVGTLRLLGGAEFARSGPLEVDSADLAGPLKCPAIRARGTVRLRAGARFFGDLTAERLVVEDGAVLVGAVRTGADWI